jgi:hypothetical protein
MFWLIDWMMDLPPDLQTGFRDELYRFEEERRMPYVTSTERLGIAEGVLKVTHKHLAMILRAKFGASGGRLASRIRGITDQDQLDELFKAVLKANSIADVRKLLAP